MALANSTRRKFLRKSDMTPMFLAALVADTQGPPEHREVLDFVGLNQHPWIDQFPQGAVIRRARVEPRGERANIVGFADRSIKIGGMEFTEQMLEPFHVKNKRMHDVESPYYSLAPESEEPMLDEAAVVMDVDMLDYRRLNLVVEAFLAMCNDKMFRYISGTTEDASDLVITIPYDHEIVDIDAVDSPTGKDFADPTEVHTLKAYRKMKSDYRENYGAVPDLMFVNPTTAGVLLTVEDILRQYRPLQSSDPDKIPSTYDEFMYDGIRHVTWHNTYVTADDPVMPAIDDGYGLLMRSTARDGGPPLRWNRAETRLNRQDATGPYFSALVEGSDEPEIGTKIYDNGIPSPADRYIVQRVKLY